MDTTERAAGGAPVWDADPFSVPFLNDPFPPLAALRDLGPAAYLPTRMHASGRYDAVGAALSDPVTLCQPRGGPERLRERKAVASAKPHSQGRSAGDTGPPGLSGCFAGGDEGAAERVRGTNRRACRWPARPRDFRWRHGFRRDLSALGVSRRARPPQGRTERAALRRDRFNAFGPDNASRREALAAAAAHVEHVAEQCLRENLDPDGLGARIYRRRMPAGFRLKPRRCWSARCSARASTQRCMG